MTLPLAGIRVVDLTQALAGPYSTMILGDLGAEVIKIESPSGDLTRSTPPHYVGDTSVYFLANNRNKKSVVIDMKNPEGRDLFLKIVGVSDVVISNFSNGVLERLQIDHDNLIQHNPSIISCSISGFGSNGPRAKQKAVDLAIQAAAGAMSITGHPGGEPARSGVATADLSAGLFATIGILAALQRRSATGLGSKVETSLFHSQLSLLNYIATYSEFDQSVPPPMGSGHLGTVPSQAFPTADGWIAVDAGFNAHFAILCEILDVVELVADDRFIDRKGRAANRSHLLPILIDRFLTKPSLTWADKLSAAGIPCAVVNDVPGALHDDQSKAYGSLVEMVIEGCTVKGLATPLWFDGSTKHETALPPRLGEHTEHVLSRLLDLDQRTIDDLRLRGAIACGS